MGSRGGRSHAGGGGNASNPSLPESLQNFESKALADYRAIRQSTGLTAQQINYIHGQLQRVIDENDLAMAVKNSLIELILHSHFKNQMETGTSQGANAPGRRAQLRLSISGMAIPTRGQSQNSSRSMATLPRETRLPPTGIFRGTATRWYVSNESV